MRSFYQIDVKQKKTYVNNEHGPQIKRRILRTIKFKLPVDKYCNNSGLCRISDSYNGGVFVLRTMLTWIHDQTSPPIDFNSWWSVEADITNLEDYKHIKQGGKFWDTIQ